jgi:dTDP-4-amino-4,6-dideoxygalactose transaminase
VAVRWSEEELSLPMFAELTPEEVSRVAEAVADAIKEEHA